MRVIHARWCREEGVCRIGVLSSGGGCGGGGKEGRDRGEGGGEGEAHLGVLRVLMFVLVGFSVASSWSWLMGCWVLRQHFGFHFCVWQCSLIFWFVSSLVLLLETGKILHVRQ